MTLIIPVLYILTVCGKVWLDSGFSISLKTVSHRDIVPMIYEYCGFWVQTWAYIVLCQKEQAAHWGDDTPACPHTDSKISHPFVLIICDLLLPLVLHGFVSTHLWSETLVWSGRRAFWGKGPKTATTSMETGRIPFVKCTNTQTADRFFFSWLEYEQSVIIMCNYKDLN